MVLGGRTSVTKDTWGRFKLWLFWAVSAVCHPEQGYLFPRTPGTVFSEFARRTMVQN